MGEWGEDKGEDMKRRVKGHVHIKRCLQLVCLGTETVFPLSAVLAYNVLYNVLIMYIYSF